MLIVVEGVDGAGKTTLIDRIARECKRPFWRLQGVNPHLPEAPLESLIEWVLEKSPRIDLVCDRFSLISEAIYGMVLRNHNRLSDFLDGETCEKLIKKFVTRIIYCRPNDPTVLFKSSQTHPQLDGVDSNLTKLLELYDHIMASLEKDLGMDVRWYDFTDPPPHDLNKFIFGDLQ